MTEDEQAYNDLLNALPSLEPKGACWVLRESQWKQIGDDNRCTIRDVASSRVVASAKNWRTLANLYEV